ncbi:MAG: SPOR domain-containing protein [Firmicutes bacterium]|nr:SPOR domain-containing protein [Bacillota bacterium]
MDGTAWVEETPAPAPAEGDTWYKVQIGAFRNLDNAVKLLLAVKMDYPDAYITTVKDYG